MLALSLEIEDEVEIWLPDGRKMVVKLVDVRGRDKIRLGFTGDRDIGVFRRKVADSIRRDNAAAARPVKPDKPGATVVEGLAACGDFRRATEAAIKR